MLDNCIYQQEWNNWKESEWQLLQFDYCLWNQQMVWTTTKPFLITEWTQLEVWNVVQWESVEVILDGISYMVTNLLSNIQERRYPYKSWEKTLEYVRIWHVGKNFMRSWFVEE